MCELVHKEQFNDHTGLKIDLLYPTIRLYHNILYTHKVNAFKYKILVHKRSYRLHT